MNTVVLYKSDFDKDVDEKGTWNDLLEAIGLEPKEEYQGEDCNIELMVHSGSLNT